MGKPRRTTLNQKVRYSLYEDYVEINFSGHINKRTTRKAISMDRCAYGTPYINTLTGRVQFFTTCPNTSIVNVIMNMKAIIIFGQFIETLDLD